MLVPPLYMLLHDTKKKSCMSTMGAGGADLAWEGRKQQ